MFTILLIILIVLALVTVVMSLAGVEGVQGATVANVATAPVKGFTDALPVCLFVLILGGFWVSSRKRARWTPVSQRW